MVAHAHVSDVTAACLPQVGIEDCLHIEFEYQKSKYHLKDVVVGKIFFLLVRIKIKHMEIEIRRRESTGSGANTYAHLTLLALRAPLRHTRHSHQLPCCAPLDLTARVHRRETSRVPIRPIRKPEVAERLACAALRVPCRYNESDTIAKYEIMDGAPVRGVDSPPRHQPYSISLIPLSPAFLFSPARV
jgi:hypothetical protein